MGKDKGKAKKQKKDKKKHKKQKHRSSSEERWVEKDASNSSDAERIEKSKRKRKHSSSSDDESIRKRGYNETSSSDDKEIQNKGTESDSGDKHDRKKPSVSGQTASKRDDWMGLPTSFLTSSNSERKREREEEKRLERERQQYNPRECPRELNPYWKDGGDGLPKFKKPESDDENDRVRYNKRDKFNNGTSNWKKKKQISEHCEVKISNEHAKTESNTNIVKSSIDDNIVSEKELNVLAAKLVKAEIMGNTKLVNELKEKLEKARSARSTGIVEDEILLTHTDSKGRSQPVKLQSEYGESSGHHRRKKNIETHQDGQRVRYFADDDKYSLKQMFENERYNSVEDQNREFINMASKVRKNDDLDEVFSDNIRKKESDSKIDSRNRDKAISEQNKISQSLDNCNRCIQSELMLKHLMISMGETTYLALPPYEPLTEGHCCIMPIRHVPCSTQLDENEWSDVLDMRRSLVNLFKSKDEDVIFFETAMSLHRFNHMYIECIPLPREEGDMAPIYFKKAIDESETEWAQNKKLVSLKGRDIRKAVPRGLPYFTVSFGMEEGFAHVIEDEKLFPANFAQEIIGGMLDLDHSKWRKPKRQSFDDQSKRVLNFSKEWKHFDCTA